MVILMLDRNLLLGFGAGVVAGIVGYKMFNKNKDSISQTINSLIAQGQGANNANTVAPQTEDNAPKNDLSLEELEAQKERLEDLIAEYQAKCQDQAQDQNPQTNDKA